MTSNKPSPEEQLAAIDLEAAGQVMSTVASPVMVVHQLVAEMIAKNPSVRRRDLVETALKVGCAYYTARTQVQIALKKMKSAT
jgi:hypothetical protein